VGHKKRILVQILKKCLEIEKFLIVQGNFGKFIDVLKACKWEIPD